MLKFGNKKVPSTSMIFNLRSASNCPGAILGICKNINICYARSTEKRWKKVRAYRDRQEIFYSRLSSKEIAEYFIMSIKPRRIEGKTINAIRFSEAGDFLNQEEVDKFTDVFSRVKKELPDIIIYGYTSRYDLDFSAMMKTAVVQGSGFMLSNNFIIVEQIDKSKCYCSSDCSKCNLCLFSRGLTIQVKKHR